MEWLVIVVLLVYIGGLAVVTIDALRHANKSSANNNPKKVTVKQA